MAIMLEEYITEEQNSVVRFLWAKGLNAKHIKREMFPVYNEKCFSRKEVHNWWHTFADEEAETEARKWLRHQLKCFYAAGFGALVKRWDKCISVGGGYVEKYMFFPGCILHQLLTYLLTFPRTYEKSVYLNYI
jgi:hypothetical protein